MADTDNQGRRLKAAREAAGFESAAAAAERFGWSKDSYAQHENGTRGLTRVAERYARAFRVSAAWLTHGEGGGPGGAQSAEVSELMSLFGELSADKRAALLMVARSLAVAPPSSDEPAPGASTSRRR